MIAATDLPTLATLGPFEPTPEIAVAVSGGSDSMALTLLADEWIRATGGRLRALTVDHALRDESAAEARRVGNWLSAYGIEHHVLRWPGEWPETGIQEAARQARYELLEGWCASHGILHLLVGHQADDQAETVQMRRHAGSGARGLAGMASIVERHSLRLLRPLLPVPRSVCRAYLASRGQDWIDDPSNADERFLRAKMRRDSSATVSSDEAVSAAQARVSMDTEVARFGARHCAVYHGGYALIEAGGLRSAPEAIARRALESAVAAVGGQLYPPRSARLDRLFGVVRDELKRARTLAGCRVAPWRRWVAVSREERALPAPAPLPRPGATVVWDRFCVRNNGFLGENARIDAVGRRGLAQLKADGWRDHGPIPHPAKLVLPAIWRGDTVSSVPHLGYNRIDDGTGTLGVKISFVPPLPLYPAEFGIV